MYDTYTNHKDFTYTIYAGPVNKNGWLLGIGGYRLINPHKRLIFVLTKVLQEGTQEEPLPGYSLSLKQYKYLEKFALTWAPFIKTTFESPATPNWVEGLKLLLKHVHPIPDIP